MDRKIEKDIDSGSGEPKDQRPNKSTSIHGKKPGSQSPSILSEILNASNDGEQPSQSVRTATPIVSAHTSITQTRPKKAKNNVPLKPSLQPIKDNGSESPIVPSPSIEDPSAAIDVPTPINETTEIQEKQPLKPKGGIQMFQSKELFQAISMRQTNQNSTIRDNLKRIEEQNKQESPPQENTEMIDEKPRHKSLAESHTSRSPSMERHAYVSWAPSELELSLPSTEEKTSKTKSPDSKESPTETTTISTATQNDSNWQKMTSDLLKTDIHPERTYQKAINDLKKTSSMTSSSQTRTQSPSAKESNREESVSNIYTRSSAISRRSMRIPVQLPEKHEGDDIPMISPELVRETGFYEDPREATRTLLVPNDISFMVSDTTHKVNVKVLDLEEGTIAKEIHQDIAPSKYHMEYLESTGGSKLPFVKKLYKILGNSWFCAMRINLDDKSISVNGVYILVSSPQEIYVCIGTNKNVKKQEYAYDIARNQFTIDYPKAIIDTLGLTSPLFWQYVDLPPPPYITDPTLKPITGTELDFDETDESERTFTSRARLFGWRRGFEEGSEEEVFEAPFSIACMNIYSILILVTRKDVYIWFETLEIHNRPAVLSKVYKFAKKVFNDAIRPEFSSILICSSGGEPFHFRKFFIDWPCETMVARELYRLVGIYATELERDLPRFSSIDSEKGETVEIGIIQQMWNVMSNETSVLVPYEQIDILFSGSIYLFVVQVTQRTLVSKKVTHKKYYRWTGVGALLMLESKNHNKYLPPAFSDIAVIDVEEGEEPKEFLNLFPNGFVCLFGEHRDMISIPKPFPPGAMRVIQVASYQSGIVRAFQVEFDEDIIGTPWSAIIHNMSENGDSRPISANLSAIFCYIFELSKKVYIWIGSGSWESERSFARTLTERLAKLDLDPEIPSGGSKPIIMVNQFQEPSSFFEDIRVKLSNVYPSNMIAMYRKELEHASPEEQRPSGRVVYTTSIPRVFRFGLKYKDDCTVPNDISDVDFEKVHLPIHAVNLQSDSIYLHDTGDEWILWVGSKTKFNYRQTRFIYISTTVLSRHFPSTLPTNRTIMVTCEGYESHSFKTGIIGWNYRKRLSDYNSSKSEKNWLQRKLKLMICSCMSKDVEEVHAKHKDGNVISLPVIPLMQRPRADFHSYKDLMNMRIHHLFGGASVTTVNPKSIHFAERETTHSAE